MTWNISNKEVLLTGGTGSLSKTLIPILLKHKPRGIRVYSRSEQLQWQMKNDKRFDGPVSYLIGDVRDKDRLRRAMEGVDAVFHTAAIKMVPVCEKDPIEAIRTNVDGAINVIDAALDARVERVMNVSTDKAVNSTNLYGHTKACAEKLFVHANVYRSGIDNDDYWKQRHTEPPYNQKWIPEKPNITRFACCRYGNVLGSRGSVVPLFRRQAEQGIITLTDPRMTRFWITLSHVAQFLLDRLCDMEGGEIYIPKMPSMKVVEVAECILPDDVRVKLTGVRQGEKIHETLITEEEGKRAADCGDYYTLCRDEFREAWVYNSGTNEDWLTPDRLAQMLEEE